MDLPASHITFNAFLDSAVTDGFWSYGRTYALIRPQIESYNKIILLGTAIWGFGWLRFNFGLIFEVGDPVSNGEN